MTTPVPNRFSDDELQLIDELVAEGIGENRSAVIRRAVGHLVDAISRARLGAAIAGSFRHRPQTTEDDELAMASATAAHRGRAVAAQGELRLMETPESVSTRRLGERSVGGRRRICGALEALANC